MSTIRDFTITRFSFRRDRVIGDSQVRADCCYAAALELHTDDGLPGLGFMLQLFHPLPDRSELERAFRLEAFPGLRGQPPAGMVHRVLRPRGGNNRALPYGFGEVRDIQIGLIEGRAITARAAPNEGVKASEVVILKPSFMGMSIDLLKALQWVKNRLGARVGRP